MFKKFNPESTNYKFLFYGESGVGKTRLASTFPDPIYLDTEKGLASVVKPVDFVPIESARQAWQVLDELKRDTEHQTVVLDSLTKFQQILIESTIVDYPGVKRTYDLVPTLGDYGKILFELNFFLNQLYNLRKHIVLIGVNTQKAYDEDIIQPALTGKMTAKTVCAAMDIIAFTTKIQKEQEVVYLTIFNLATHVTKDRTGKLPVAIQDCTWDKISNYLFGTNGG
jgi:GTPase SAR1 family protein